MTLLWLVVYLIKSAPPLGGAWGVTLVVCIVLDLVGQRS